MRRAFLARNPSCAVCGGRKGLNVHHIEPFHLRRDLELRASNLITLCEGNRTINCHLRFGHLGNYARKYNPRIRTEAAKWRTRFTAKAMDDISRVEPGFFVA